MSETINPPEEWAKVEIFGHRQHVGRITEVERFGSKMLRIDEPTAADPEVFTTHFYGGQSIFSITFVTEDAARDWASRYRRASPRPALTVDGGDIDEEGPF